MSGSPPAGSGSALAPTRETPEVPVYADPTLRDRLRRFRANRELWIGLMLVGVFVVVGLSAALSTGGNVDQLVPQPTLIANPPAPGPSAAHPLGILGLDGGGVDEARALYLATPVDLAVLFAILVPAALLGVLVGGVAGASEGGGVDLAITAWADIIAGVPAFFLVAVLYMSFSEFVKPDLFLVVFVVTYAAVLWPYYARPVRARARQVAARPFVEAAEAAGARTGRLLRRHILPNSFSPVLAQVPVDVAGVYFVLSVFPFLACFLKPEGFGFVTPLPTPTFPEWGYLLAQGSCYGWSLVSGADAWWMYVFPAAVMVAFGVSVALACDGLQRRLEGSPGTG
jgi:peptide/nickel transport system permease protein